MASAPKKHHYVDNKQLYAVMIEYKKSVSLAEDSGDSKPQIPDYVGRCLLQIANRLATKPNFANYQFKSDMISDGIENCVSYIDNFDPEKSKNPFAYFTQIIYYAFLRRIQKEKKQLYIKHKMLERSMIMNTLADGDDDHVVKGRLDSGYMVDFVEAFEEKEAKTKKKRTATKGVEKFYNIS
jgi:hypothetical protein